MRSSIASVLLAIAALLPPIGASAATITTFSCSTGSCASSIDGLVIGGGTYDVDFVYGTWATVSATYSFIYLGDSGGAAAATDAINAALEGANLIGAGPSVAHWNNLFIVPYEEPGTDVLAMQGLRTSFAPLDWSRFDTPADPDAGGSYAVISAVPLPAAVWLFGGALGLLGAVRRRAT